MIRVDIREGERITPHLKEHREIYGHIVTNTGVHIREYKIKIVSRTARMSDWVNPATFMTERIMCRRYGKWTRLMNETDWGGMQLIILPERWFTDQENEDPITRYNRAMGVL